MNRRHFMQLMGTVVAAIPFLPAFAKVVKKQFGKPNELWFTDGQVIAHQDFIFTQPLVIHGSNLTFHGCNFLLRSLFKEKSIIVLRGKNNAFFSCLLDAENKAEAAIYIDDTDYYPTVSLSTIKGN